jgi:hypothetical protein
MSNSTQLPGIVYGAVVKLLVYSYADVDYILCQYACKVGHSGLAARGMNCLRSLGRWDHGFESHSRHGYLCAFIRYLCYPMFRKRPFEGLISRLRSPADWEK